MWKFMDKKTPLQDVSYKLFPAVDYSNLCLNGTDYNQPITSVEIFEKFTSTTSWCTTIQTNRA